MKCIKHGNSLLNLTSAMKIEQYWKDKTLTIIEFPACTSNYGHVYLISEKFDTVLDFVNSDFKILECSFRSKSQYE